MSDSLAAHTQKIQQGDLFLLAGYGLCIALYQSPLGFVSSDRLYLYNSESLYMTSIIPIIDAWMYTMTGNQPGKFECLAYKKCDTFPVSLSCVMAKKSPKRWDWISENASIKEEDLTLDILINPCGR